MHQLLYLKDVVTLKLDPDRCNGCRMCIKVCPHDVFEITDNKARIIRRDYCMECGACEMNCPENAIQVRSGVGCAAGILSGYINNTEPSCGCSKDSVCC